MVDDPEGGLGQPSRIPGPRKSLSLASLSALDAGAAHDSAAAAARPARPEAVAHIEGLMAELRLEEQRALLSRLKVLIELSELQEMIGYEASVRTPRVG